MKYLLFIFLLAGCDPRAAIQFCEDECEKPWKWSTADYLDTYYNCLGELKFYQARQNAQWRCRPSGRY